MKLSDIMILTEKASECKGRIFRGKVNAYIGSRGEYVYQEKMTPMKSKSCSGCEDCGWIDDDLYEFINYGTLPIIKDIEDGALYSLQAINGTRDWESGIMDDWELEFIKIKED